MASEEKTERATPWRRRKARERGQVARSQELTGAASLTAAVVVLFMARGRLLDCGRRMMAAYLQQAASEPAGAAALFEGALAWGMQLLAPVLVTTLVVALISNMAQVGFLFSLYPLRWDLNRLSPIEGLRRLFSVEGAAQAVKSILKFGVTLAVGWWAVRRQVAALVAVGRLSLPEALQVGMQSCWEVAMNCSAVLVVLGAADYGYQRYMHERRLMLSRPELKEELRETEGDPLVQARRRQQRRALLEGGITPQLPQASVVVTNPTHIAVALKYNRQMEAPVVVAKGKGELARRIVHYARLYGIPVHEDKPLAQVLYKQAELGEMIPPALYRAVAEVLAIIIRRKEELRRRRMATQTGAGSRQD